MKTKLFLERLSIILLMFVIGCGLLFLTGWFSKDILGWVIFSDLLEKILGFGLLFSVIAIFALSLLNIALNVSIYVGHNLQKEKVLLPTNLSAKTNLLSVAGLFVFLSFLIGIMFFIHRGNLKEKSDLMKEKMTTFVTQNKSSLNKIGNLFETKSNPYTILKAIKNLRTLVSSYRQFSIIYPMPLANGKTLYKKIRPNMCEYKSDKKSCQKHLFYGFDADQVISFDSKVMTYLSKTYKKEIEMAPRVFIKGRRYKDEKILYPLKTAKGHIFFIYADYHSNTSYMNKM